MKILMIAPQPFMEERGAPFAIYHHIKALLCMGHTVDLVTYHIGKPVELPGLHIFRIPTIPGIHQVKVGPSMAKFPLDLLVFFVALWRLCITRYDCMHTHEEAGAMGVLLSLIFGRKHLYYMHSDLSQQIVSSEFTKNPFIIHCVKLIQKLIVRKAHGIIAICPDIERTARGMTSKTPIHMIENSAVDENLPAPTMEEVLQIREELALGTGPVLLYTGTLESYQGIDLLIHSIPAVYKVFPDIHYVLVGGQTAQIERLSTMAKEFGVYDAIRFIGQKPLAEMPRYMALADILLSPRSKGTNTPLKLYTYLHSGKPILATEIYSQTQVLSSETALLVPPTADGLAEGAIALLRNPQWAKALGGNGRLFAEEHYSWRVFLKKSTYVQEEFSADLLEMAA
ncbi:glycoside hydrolase [Dictyobacter vulcani]|uniref:Glycoside hydrolase n=1 Tax=Dictyobacter vulcani TaxID=2607529 RepID=A0A5J4KIE1_9CHLR|nr:glycosyltransferase family 4 protein [Dictyobacter vulcani]GER86010.1 glycoside hydrolase [Dictyobacter vulcani]